MKVSETVSRGERVEVGKCDESEQQSRGNVSEGERERAGCWAVSERLAIGSALGSIFSKT